jgi:uroporphyrinogen-III synthase
VASISCVPFIDIQFEKIENTPSEEWVFFSSPNAVKSVLTQVVLPEEMKIAVLGEGTRLAVETFDRKADFVGQDADAAVVARAFSQDLGVHNVWIPKSDKSLNRVEIQLPPEQVRSQITYRNTPVSKRLGITPDVLVFTSPSNVEGFLLENTIHANQCIISIGNTTKEYMLERLPEIDVQMALRPTLEELSRLVREYYNKLS